MWFDCSQLQTVSGNLELFSSQLQTASGNLGQKVVQTVSGKHKDTIANRKQVTQLSRKQN